MVKKLTPKGSRAGKSSQKDPAPRVKKPRGKGKPFQKNDPETGFMDERINRTGQNAKYTEFHRMLDDMFHEKVEIMNEGKVEKTMTNLESMARLWFMSQDFNKQNKLLEYYVGKVPDELNIRSSEAEEFVKENIDLFTDGQIERLGRGEKPWIIIAELLRDTIEAKRKQGGNES